MLLDGLRARAEGPLEVKAPRVANHAGGGIAAGRTGGAPAAGAGRTVRGHPLHALTGDDAHTAAYFHTHAPLGRRRHPAAPPPALRAGGRRGAGLVGCRRRCSRRARPAARAQSRRGTCGGAPGQHRGRATCESAAEHLVAVSANQVALRRVIDGTSSCEAGVTMTGRAIAACKPAAFRAGKTGTAAAHPSPGAKASSSLHPTGSRRASVSSSALT